MSTARAYYNEIDSYAAAWLRNLIAAGLIAPGDVDERSIEDVRPDDLRGYTQCHFFAGIGVWSLALRRAGWSDDREIWTGSCPCQPFSAAGKGAGFADERHLWPAFHWLIQQCRPAVVAGEQVASKDGLGWLDLVQADLEGTGYASRAVDLCAAGVGAPHIRQRLWWIGERMADAESSGSGTGFCSGGSTEHGWVQPANNSAVRGLADADGRNAGAERQQCGGEQRQQPEDGRVLRLEHPGSERREWRQETAPGHEHDRAAPIGPEGQHGRGVAGASGLHQDRTSPTNGRWRDADWLFCRDGKWRPVEPSTFPLAHGAPSRVGRLRAYGNAIVADAAQTFIEAYLDTLDDRFRLTDVSLLSPAEDVFS